MKKISLALGIALTVLPAAARNAALDYVSDMYMTTAEKVRQNPAKLSESHLDAVYNKHIAPFVNRDVAQDVHKKWKKNTRALLEHMKNGDSAEKALKHAENPTKGPFGIALTVAGSAEVIKTIFSLKSVEPKIPTWLMDAAYWTSSIALLLAGIYAIQLGIGE